MTMPRARTSPAGRSPLARGNRPPRHRAVSISCVAPQRNVAFASSGMGLQAACPTPGEHTLADANCPSLIIRYIWDRASGALRRADTKLIVASIRVTVRSLLFRARQVRVECLPHLRGSLPGVRQTLEVENRGVVRGERDPGRQTERRRALTLAVQISQKRLQLRPMAPPTHRTRRAPRLVSRPGR